MKKKVRFSRSWLALPYALFLAVFVVVPLFFIVYYAFRDDVTGELTFGNFKAFFTSPVNLKVAGRSLLISFLSTAACLLIAYPVAYIIARQNEIKAVRMILSAKLNDLPEQTIKERLRDMYV